MTMFPFVPPHGGDYSYEFIRKQGPKIARIVGIGALVIGSISILDEIAPGDEPSVAHNMSVDACSQELAFTETRFIRSELPAVCIRFSDQYERTDSTIAGDIEEITMPPNDTFVDENTVGAEYDESFHQGNRKRAAGWLAVACVIFGAGGWQKRRRNNDEYNASRQAMFAELDVILQPPYDNQ